ncbi:hypothetical protein PHET_01237 [Paragonimus heterotremus]|uniref:UBA domain-containing protein n=1 Tax=Paragonimus heterotremus TaxID=100268 RepID=A0A8J4SSI1_9TREM|nr:hypothetical protein PHET_01237 [Paragonimus heterotremus]
MDLDEDVEKLKLMGFTNEQDVRNALKCTDSDINGAISMLMCSTNSERPRTTDESQLSHIVDLSDGGFQSNFVVLQPSPLPDELEHAPVVGHDLRSEFSSSEFSRLQSRAYIDQWDIPCLRSQSLGKCILGVIHEFRSHGLKVVETNSDIREFVTVCLLDCVTKLMTSQAVFNWDRETLEGVHNMLELSVHLVCEYLTVFKQAVWKECNSCEESDVKSSSQAAADKPDGLGSKTGSGVPRCLTQFAWELLRMLGLIFDCEANYHQLCRDRSSNTGTYSDPFNDWTALIQSKLGRESPVFAETLPSPRNFYLVNLINCFGVYGGFRMLHWLGTQSWANITLLSSLLSPMANCADYLTAYTLQRHCGVVLMQRVLWRLSNLNEDDFKDRDSRIFDVITSLRVLTYRLSDLGIAYSLLPFLTSSDSSNEFQSPRQPDWESFPLTEVVPSWDNVSATFFIAQVDKLHCTLLLSALSPPHGSAGASFNGRMLALRNLVEQLEAAKMTLDSETHQTRVDGERASGGFRRRPVAQLSSATLLASENAAFLVRRGKRRAIRFEFLMNWFREKEVILKSMRKNNLDNTAYMSTLGQLFRLLGERITSADLTTVWHRTTTQPGVAVDNVLTLLTDVASTRFIQPQMNHLLYLVEASWLNLNRQAYMHNSSHKRKEPTTHVAMYSSDEPSHVRHGRARLLNMVGRIGTLTKEGWKFDLCAELLWDLAHGTFSRVNRVTSNRESGVGSKDCANTVATEPDQLTNSLTYFMLAYIKSLLELILKNFVGRAKRDSLNELIRTHDLITQVVASLLRYEQWAVQSHGDMLNADSLDMLGFRHSDVIKRHFELLHYLLRNAELSLNAERAKALWENLIGHPRVGAFDREQCFTWFTASLNYLEPETQTMLFTKLVLKSNPVLFRSFAGFECFKALFEKVNLHEGRMRQVTKTWHVEKPDLIGLDFLWDLYLALPSLDASLDGGHIRAATDNAPIKSGTNGSSPTPSAGNSEGKTSNATDGSANHANNISSSPSVAEPNAVKLARQLLLDVHWGQLAPRLRRYPETCYRRFFDACRRRLESNWAIGRGLTPKRGVHSALAETGQLLAALIVGPGPAGRAKHCNQTAARLALRRLLGLVYAYIQTVEDEMFGARAQHPNWRPHGTTFRGWEMRLPLRVETLKPGQTTPVAVGLTGTTTTITRNVFAVSDNSTILAKQSGAAPPVSILVHANEMLGSVRDRTNLISTAILFSNRSCMDGISSSAEPTTWSASALYIGPPCVSLDPLSLSQNKSSSVMHPTATAEPTGSQHDNSENVPKRPCSKKILETVLNRQTVGELGFQNGRILTVRLIAGLNNRGASRVSRLSAASPIGASTFTLSLCSAGPSALSLSAANASDADLVARATAALNSAGSEERNHRSINNAFSSFIQRQSELASVSPNLDSSAAGSASTGQLPRGTSLLSLSSAQITGTTTVSASTSDLTVNQPAPSGQLSHHTLPSLCMGEDASVYELLLELADSELSHALSTTCGGDMKRTRCLSSVTPTGLGLTPSFSLIHPIRLLLATLPTYRPTSMTRASSHLQQTLFCSPNNLLKSTAYRTLYKLQILSASLIPVDTSPWWDVSPGCLLSPPSQLYSTNTVFATSVPPASSSSRGSIISRVRQVERRTNLVSCDSDSHASALIASNPDSKWFLSTDALGFGSSQKLSSVSAPSSPVLRRRKNFKFFMGGGSGAHAIDSDSLKVKNNTSLVANVQPIEFLEPLIRLLRRQTPSSNQELPVLHPTGLLHPSTPYTTQIQSILSANVAWWRREVRHLCLQLLSFLLNPHGNTCDLKSNVSVDSEGSAGCAPPHNLTPTLVAEFLSALLETAVTGAGVAELLPQRQSCLEPRGIRKQLKCLSVYQLSKDSRAGVAGLIEVSAPNGQCLLFQDVEVSVQSIHLLFQCVMAYPNQFLNAFLALDHLEEKLLRLLVYSPSSRVRSETARQLEHLSLLSSRYLRFGEHCLRDWDSPFSDRSNPSPLCLTHTRIFHPQLLHFLLRVLFQARLPFFTTHVDMQPNSTLMLLLTSSEYFRVRAFLLGQTPLRLLKNCFNTDHLSLLREEFTWFRKMVEVESNFYRSKRDITDCLLTGHLESARILCAQTVACVLSHSLCTLSGVAAASSLASDVHAITLGRTSSVYTGWDSRYVSVPIVLLNALAESPMETNLAEGTLTEEDESTPDLKLSHPLASPSANSTFPITSENALRVSSSCLKLAGDFVYYLITECLFPAATHILQWGSFKTSSNPRTTLQTSLLALRALEPVSLRSNLVSLASDSRSTVQLTSNTVTPTNLLSTVGSLTRKTAFNFLIFVARVDVHSLERIVDLLILLHHNEDPALTSPSSVVSSAGPNSIVPTPENVSACSSPRLSTVTEDLTIGSRQFSFQKGVWWDLQPALVGRTDGGFVGLRNRGATCYMNAILQQLFMQPGLTEALLSITETDELDEGNILLQTQRLLGHLLESQMGYYDPVDFLKSFRPWDTSEAVNPGEQQDAFDFFQALIDQLDEELKKLKREPFFQAIYQGIFLDSKFCDECEHRYDREEVFSAINLAIKTHDLQEALNQFVRGEVLDGENAYYCERCHVKRRAVKRLSVHTLPPVLCLNLKRFDFDWNRQVPVKFSDHFTFPRQLDMGPFMADSVQNDRIGQHRSTRTGSQSSCEYESKSGSSTAPEVPCINLIGEGQSPETTVTQKSAFSLDTCPDSQTTELKKGRVTHPSMTILQHQQSLQEHLYRLVGIVVHSGQANSGHYYAFIKDRGRGDYRDTSEGQNFLNSREGCSQSAQTDGHSTNRLHKTLISHAAQQTLSSESKNNSSHVRFSAKTSSEENQHSGWYRFNDTSIEPIELTDSFLEHECFGGSYIVTGSDGRAERRTRFWSAYLLFYERVNLNHEALRQSLTVGKSVVDSTSEMHHTAFDSAVEMGDKADASPKRPTLKFSLSGSMDNMNYGQAEQHGTSSVLRKYSEGIHENVSNLPSDHLPSNQETLAIGSTCPMPRRVAHQIWADNWAFLRDRNIYSRDYFDFIRGLCEGILEDVGSLRQEPQRGVLGTRLLAHFFFTTFIRLHARSKALIAGSISEGQVQSLQTLKELSIQQNSEWLGLLVRLASTSPKACRWLMHYLSTSPAQPCLVYLLLAPKPTTRQQLANMLLTVLRAFYWFKETNILDGALTGLINHLLSFIDSGLAAEYATEAGTLFAMLRGYAEMCPHASLHLVNLKTITRLLTYFMEGDRKSFKHLENAHSNSPIVIHQPTWADKLRTWTPAQLREMGNLYYLLVFLISHTCLDEYRTVDPSQLHKTSSSSSVISSYPTRQNCFAQMMLRPQKETVAWLGLLPLSRKNETVDEATAKMSSTHSTCQSSEVKNVFTVTNDTYLVGLYRLCEILLRAYLENPATPNLASSLGLTEGLANKYTGFAASGHGLPTNNSTTCITGAGSAGCVSGAALGTAVTTTSSQGVAKTGDESLPLRHLICQAMLHIAYCSWEASFCFIILLLSRVSTRPQSELRYLFDLMSELLRMVDPLQTARIAAVVDGLRNRSTVNTASPVTLNWCPRPNADPKLWAWDATEIEHDVPLQTKSSSNHSIGYTGMADDKSSVILSEEESNLWPPMPKGLLELTITESCQDSRRAYQCMKFVVNLSSENTAVMSYLSRFPERWEPAVKWLENLMDYSDDDGGSALINTPTHTVPQSDDVDNRISVDQSCTGGLYMVITPASPTSQPDHTSRTPDLGDFSNESDEKNTGFQRTMSAQVTFGFLSGELELFIPNFTLLDNLLSLREHDYFLVN